MRDFYICRFLRFALGWLNLFISRPKEYTVPCQGYRIQMSDVKRSTSVVHVDGIELHLLFDDMILALTITCPRISSVEIFLVGVNLSFGSRRLRPQRHHRHQEQRQQRHREGDKSRRQKSLWLCQQPRCTVVASLAKCHDDAKDARDPRHSRPDTYRAQTNLSFAMKAEKLQPKPL